MADPPSVTAILPTRNRPALLAEALHSVLAQTVPPAQVIIVDDGGADDAERLVEPTLGLSEVAITVLRGPGRGPGAARNAALRAATGELIAFLDDDDLWWPRKIEMQTEWFRRCPTLGILGTGHTAGCRPVQPKGKTGGSRSIRSIPLGALLRANRLVASSVMARRSCLQQLGGFDESLPLAQDWDLWLRTAEKAEVAILPAPLVFYRRHAEQRSADLMEMRRWEREVIRRALARGISGRWLIGVARRRMAWSHARLGRLMVRRGDVRRAREEFREAVNLSRCNPVAWVGLMLCKSTTIGAAFLSRPGRHRNAHLSCCAPSRDGTHDAAPNAVASAKQ